MIFSQRSADRVGVLARQSERRGGDDARSEELQEIADILLCFRHEKNLVTLRVVQTPRDGFPHLAQRWRVAMALGCPHLLPAVVNSQGSRGNLQSFAG